MDLGDRLNAHSRGKPPLSRRQFLSALSAAGFFGQLGPGCAIAALGPAGQHEAAAASSASAFEEMLPSVTGITWSHVNGRSPEMYLPETTGAGCAFLDYDNDGWMDVDLVSNG